MTLGKDFVGFTMGNALCAPCLDSPPGGGGAGVSLYSLPVFAGVKFTSRLVQQSSRAQFVRRLRSYVKVELTAADWPAICWFILRLLIGRSSAGLSYGCGLAGHLLVYLTAADWPVICWFILRLLIGRSSAG